MYNSIFKRQFIPDGRILQKLITIWGICHFVDLVLEPDLPYSYEFESSNGQNVSAVFYPVGVCDIAVQKLRIPKCEKCLFVGRTRKYDELFTFVIPYPGKVSSRKNFLYINDSQLRETNVSSITNLMKNNAFTFIPLAENNSEQNIVLR